MATTREALQELLKLLADTPELVDRVVIKPAQVLKGAEKSDK